MRLTISLREQDFRRLQDLARDERRPVRDQAAYLVEQKLREERSAGEATDRSAAEGAP